jgi:hypothetical protein
MAALKYADLVMAIAEMKAKAKPPAICETKKQAKELNARDKLIYGYWGLKPPHRWKQGDHYYTVFAKL